MHIVPNCSEEDAMKFREGFFRFSGKFLGIDYAMLPNCEWKQKHKKQPWGNVECFAFGGATVRFASLETNFGNERTLRLLLRQT